MSKIKIYLLILAVAIIAVALGYMMHIQSLCAASLTYMKNPVLPVTAAVCAFLFYGVKNYWLIIIGCAIVTAVVMQFVIVGHGTTIFLFTSRALAFLVVVYLMNLVKLIFNEA